MPMSDPEKFYALKAAVEAQYRSRYPSCVLPIHDWKGQEIVNFQEDLQAEVKGRISEKWFYTHIKARTNAKLPRIDMLNMLSQYAGFRDWPDFRFQLAPPVQVETETETETISPERAMPETAIQLVDLPDLPRNKRGIRLLVLGGLAVAMLLAGFLLIPPKLKTTYTFCFVDADQGKALANAEISVTILREEESPLQRDVDAQGCFSYPTSAEKVRFVVQAPYYKSDTITRLLNKSLLREEIPLKADDYALMIRVFSTSSLKDWKKRREQLEGMIAESAEIFQLSPENQRGMEIYNKDEFITKMTMPIKSLRNVEVLETRYNQVGKIIGMRFVQLKTP